jgi:hypothetical protein
MDAEIWSYADTKNGRLILRALSIVIILKELAVNLLPVFGLPTVNPIWAPFEVSPALAQLRGPLLLALTLTLVLCLNLGFSWGRRALGLAYLFTAGYAIAVTLQEPPTGLGPMLILGNSAAGLVIALTLLFSAQLKAHLWRKAATRLIIPIPAEDEPALRPDRRVHSLGESIMIGIRRLIGLLFVLAVLIAIAHLNGLTRPLLDALRH